MQAARTFFSLKIVLKLTSGQGSRAESRVGPDDRESSAAGLGLHQASEACCY